MRRLLNLIACSEFLILLLGSQRNNNVDGFVSPRGTVVVRTKFSFQLYDVSEPLVTEGDWQAYLDEETTGMVYYFNSVTGESMWQPPTDTFPDVYLKPSLRRRAERLRESYFESLNQDALREEEKGVGILGALFKQREEEIVEEDVPDWIQTVLDEGAREEPLVEKEEPGFFSKLLASKDEGDAVGDDDNAAATGDDADAAAVVAEEDPVVEPESTTPSLFKSMFNTIDKVKQDAASRAEEAQQAAEKVREAAAQRAQEAREAAAQRAQKAREAAAQRAQKAKEVAAEARATAARNAEKAREARAQKAKEAQEAAARKAEAAEAKAAAKAAEKEERNRMGDAERKEEERKEKARVAQAALEAKLAEAEKLAAQAKQAALDRAGGVRQKNVVKTTEIVKPEVGSCVLPHPAKILWGGEDAVFTKGRNFAVFDGVSGADKTDGVPLYSKTLVRELQRTVGTDSLTVKELQDSLLEAAKYADEAATGASTALVGSISEDGFLRAINLGDSSCIVVRNDKVAARTKEIVHYFDCPYQLSLDSPDRPRDARKLNVELVRGDIVVAGSDGVFDNLTELEIVDLVQKGKNKKSSVLARQVSDLSRKVSLNQNIETPYSKQAKRNGDPDYKDGLGGKVDDISCVVIRYE